MQVKIGLAQIPVVADKRDNLRVAAEAIAACKREGAQIAVLPEMFCCPYQTSYFPVYAEPRGGEVWSALSEMAQDNGVLLFGGSMPERGENGAIHNTCFVFDKNGNEITCHRKMHLFDIDIKGGQRFMESETLTAGDSLTVVDTEFGKIGVAICFDIRFPEPFRLMANYGARMVIVPAAFNMTTGPAHWEITFRTRALDNQCFVFGCAPARDEKGLYVSYGNSIAVSPWGAVIGRLDEKAGILAVAIHLGDADAVREQLPLLKALRRDLFDTCPVE